MTTAAISTFEAMIDFLVSDDISLTEPCILTIKDKTYRLTKEHTISTYGDIKYHTNRYKYCLLKFKSKTTEVKSVERSYAKSIMKRDDLSAAALTKKEITYLTNTFSKEKGYSEPCFQGSWMITHKDIS